MSKREHILTIAEELFAEHGYEGTSVRTLAKTAGVNLAMISYYFGSKEKLFTELVEYRASFFREKLRGVNKEVADPHNRIDLMVELIVDRLFSNPRFHRLIHHEMALQQRSELTSNIASILMQNIAEVKKVIREGIDKKVFRKVDVEMTVCALFSTTSQIVQSTLISTKILSMPDGKDLSKDEKIKKRTKLFLKDLLKTYLVNKRK